MNRYPDFAHCVTALVNVPAARAFAFLADPLSLGTWSLGCMRTQAAKAPMAGGVSARGGPFIGTSLYDDSPASFDVRAHPELLLIDYLVGDAGNLKPRNSVRV